MYTKKEIAVIKADREYWEFLAKLVGWRLRAFSYRQSASYDTDSVNDIHGSSIQLTGQQRDQLVTAIIN